MKMNIAEIQKILLKIVAILAFCHFSLIAAPTGEENKPKEEKKMSAENSEILKKEIEDLHKNIKTLIKEYLEVRKSDKSVYNENPNPQKLSFNMGIGLKQKLGVAAKYSFEENVIVNLTGSEVTALEMYYIQTALRNAIEKKRIIYYDNINVTDLLAIRVEYNDDDGSFKKYTVGQLLTPESRSKIIYIYRDYLNRLNRTLEYYLIDFKKKEKLSIDQATNLGSD